MDVSVHISLFAFYAFLVLTARVIKVVHITQQNWGNVNYATYRMSFTDVTQLIYVQFLSTVFRF